jgi:flagellin-specific chaperone FliS
MFNYRALNWEAIEAIHQEIKAIIFREEKLAKKRFITLAFQGLKKVAKFFNRLIQYATSDETTFEYILRAANLINILRLRLDADQLKKDLDSVYQKLVALLPRDLQLSLFEDGVEFGGVPHEIRSYTANYLSNISDWFNKLCTNKEFSSKLWKKIYQFEGRLFAHVWGTQLAFSWG